MGELGANEIGLRPRDRDRVRASATIDELEEAARRLVALRNWGVTDGAAKLGITHGGDVEVGGVAEDPTNGAAS